MRRSNLNISGGFLNKKQADDLQKEIELNYINDVFTWGQDKDDIRQCIYNYDNPYFEKNLNGVNLRVTHGLLEGAPYSGNRRRTYLLYAGGVIIGKFYSLNDIMKCIN